MLLTGEAGIGKTSVAAESAADAERGGARVVCGWGWQDEGAPAFWPWVQVLRSLVGPLQHRFQLAGMRAADPPAILAP